MGNVKSRMSDPSLSIDEINVPEITDLSAEFIYNYYVSDERTLPVSEEFVNKSLDKIPRYNLIKWSPPKLSIFQTQSQSQSFAIAGAIQENSDKLISEDSSLNKKYYQHTFSNTSTVEQGVSDLEIYSRMSGLQAESMVKMAEQQIKIVADTSASDTAKDNKISNLLDSYTKLSNFPKSSLGLKIIKDGKEIKDQEDFLDSISKSTLTRIKLHGSIIPDIFQDSVESETEQNTKNFNKAYANSTNLSNNSPDLISVDPVKVDGINNASYTYLRQPIMLMGYVIDKYKTTTAGFEKISTFYIEDPATSVYVDRAILYGETYFYVIRVVAAVQTLLYADPNDGSTSTQLATLYVMSRNSSVPVECFEYVPPPPPEDIEFSFDYEKMNLFIHWEMPSNPQKDIKQFQVFRRKTIKEPFELIAQYGFDMSDPGPGGKKYITNEVVDANNIVNMLDENKILVKNFRYPVYSHLDKDFLVDTEFYVSSEYIYAVCSIDAHGMISNYSEQWHVQFDSNKNKLAVKSICSPGSPRQYPNMNLKVDTFKDTIHVDGKDLKKLKIFFTPEYLKIKDAISPSQSYKIVEAKTPVPTSKDAGYLLQLINLDNQKLQMIKINILDMKGMTV